MLFSFPDDIIRNLMLKWISLADVCKLDSAYCQTIARETLLHFVGSLPFDFESLVEATDSEFRPVLQRAMNWLIARRTDLPVVIITPELESNKSQRREFLSLHGSNVKFVRYPERATPSQCIILYDDLLKFCPNLTGLTLRQETGMDLQPLLKRIGPQLRELHIASALLEGVWQLLLEHCRGLRRLHIDRYPDSTEGGSSLAALLRQSTGLQYCRITHNYSVAMPRVDKQRVEQTLVQALAEGCPNLRALDMTPMYITDDSLLQLAKGCPLLCKIDLYHARQLSAEGKPAFFATCHSLREVKLHHRPVPPVTVAAPVPSLPGDHPAVTSSGESGSDRALSGEQHHGTPAVAQDDLCVLAVSNPHLEKLEVSFEGYHTATEAALPVTTGDVCLAALARHCAHLKHITIGSVTGNCPITDQGVEALAKGCRALECVVLFNCPALTSTAVAALAQHCPTLQRLHVQACPFLCDAALKAICKVATTEGRHCRLRELTLTNAFSVPAVLQLLQICGSLRQLCLAPPPLSATALTRLPQQALDTALGSAAHPVGPGTIATSSLHSNAWLCATKARATAGEAAATLVDEASRRGVQLQWWL